MHCCCDVAAPAAAAAAVASVACQSLKWLTASELRVRVRVVAAEAVPQVAH